MRLKMKKKIKKFSFVDYIMRKIKAKKVTAAERDIIDELYKEIPSLKDEGIENFFGYYVSYDKVLDALCEAWPDEKIGYDFDPLELVVRLTDERDEAKAEIERLKGIQQRQQQIIQRERNRLGLAEIEIRRLGVCLNAATTKNRDFELKNSRLQRQINELNQAGMVIKNGEIEMPEFQEKTPLDEITTIDLTEPANAYQMGWETALLECGEIIAKAEEVENK